MSGRMSNIYTDKELLAVLNKDITNLTDEEKELTKELKPFDEVFKKPTREQIIDLMNGKSPEEVFGNKSTSDEDEKVEV